MPQGSWALPPWPLSFHPLLSSADAAVPQTNLEALIPSAAQPASLQVQLPNPFLFFPIQHCKVQNGISMFRTEHPSPALQARHFGLVSLSSFY